MKYFTKEWYSGDLSLDEEMAVFPRYNEHIARLLPHLPSSLKVLAMDVRLHDGGIRQMALDQEAGSLDLDMHEGCDDSRPDVNFDVDLHYRSISLSRRDLDILLAIRSDLYAESLYDEIDIEQEEDKEPMYVHRLSFWAADDHDGKRVYKDVTIRFKGLELLRTPRELSK